MNKNNIFKSKKLSWLLLFILFLFLLPRDVAPASLLTVATNPANNITDTSATLNGRITDIGGTIDRIRVRMRYQGTIKTYLRLNGEESEFPGLGSVGGAWADRFTAWQPSRPGGGSWTWDDIENLQVVAGLSTWTFSGTIYQGRLTQIYVEVDDGGSILILRPDSDGDYINIENPPVGSHWDLVDDVVADDFGTYVWTDSGSEQKDAYNLQTAGATGGENAIERGFGWGTSPGVYLNNWTQPGSYGIGPFNRDIAGLAPSTTYYFIAKAKNSAGSWVHGTELSFTTNAPVPGFQDIGLRVQTPSGIVSIAAEIGVATSPLRIAKNGIVYGIALVDSGDLNDSGVRIQTANDGLKALRRY